MSLQPHQIRVLQEKLELTKKLTALTAFISDPKFQALNEHEQFLLKEQEMIMACYRDLLDLRTKDYPVPEAGTAEATLPIGTTSIDDINSFAAAIDQWHGAKIEEGNRLLELGIENDATIQIEDQANPGTQRTLELTGDVGAAFRVGVRSVLYLFQNLPFGVSVEEAPADAEG